MDKIKKPTKYAICCPICGRVIIRVIGMKYKNNSMKAKKERLCCSKKCAKLIGSMKGITKEDIAEEKQYKADMLKEVNALMKKWLNGNSTEEKLDLSFFKQLFSPKIQNF